MIIHSKPLISFLTICTGLVASYFVQSPLFALIVCGFGLLSISANSITRGLANLRNTALLLGTVVYLILFFYAIMFELIDVTPFVDTTQPSERQILILNASLLILSLIAGTHLALIFSPSLKTTSSIHEHQEKPNFFLVLAWLPILFALISYLLYFRNQPYVSLHTGDAGLFAIPLKLIYVTFGALVCISVSTSTNTLKAKMNILFILCGLLIVFGFLIKLRTPLLFATLLSAYLFLPNLGALKLLTTASLFVFILAIIALLRDPALTENGFLSGIATMILGLGEQAHSLTFADSFLDENGPLYGLGILGSLTGAREAIANEYTRSISVDYFLSGGGFGFYLLSDFVVNFGWTGGALALFLLGATLTRLSLMPNSFHSITLNVAIFANVFALSRNDFGSQFRATLYTVAATYLIRYSLIFIRSLTTPPKLNKNLDLRITGAS